MSRKSKPEIRATQRKMKVPVLQAPCSPSLHCHHHPNNISIAESRNCPSHNSIRPRDSMYTLYKNASWFHCILYSIPTYTTSTWRSFFHPRKDPQYTTKHSNEGPDAQVRFLNTPDSIVLFQVAPLRRLPIHVQVEIVCLRRRELASDSASYCSCHRERYIRGRRGCSMVSQVFE